MRTFGVDIHRRFAEVAVHEDGRTSRVGRIELGQLDAFANSLTAEDVVVIESTSITWAVVERLDAHAGRVIVSNPLKTKAIASAKVKTDKVDARVLAELGASGFIAEVWVPGPELRALRRRVAHRARLVSEKRRHRNQVHAVLARNLVEVAVTDLFGKKGRRALRQIELPDSEREQVDATLRLHDAVEAELAVLERSLSKIALASAEVRRLMTIPGIGAVTALGLLALIGDIGRFPTSRHLVGYLGLDPRVRQSGDRQARTGRISRQGQARARSLRRVSDGAS